MHRAATSLALVLVALSAACGGDDDGTSNCLSCIDADTSLEPDAHVPPVDAPPVVGEPPGLEGTTDAHNAVRAEVGVPPLTWDPQLAAIAQAWVEQCVDDQAPTGLIDHNPGRSNGYPTYVGENIYGSGGQASGVAAVELWAAEKAYYDRPTNSCQAGRVCGHYTQVVWRTTTKVGCALHRCPGLTYGSTVVCNYAPGGNSGGPPY